MTLILQSEDKTIYQMVTLLVSFPKINMNTVTGNISNAAYAYSLKVKARNPSKCSLYLCRSTDLLGKEMFHPTVHGYYKLPRNLLKYSA